MKKNRPEESGKEDIPVVDEMDQDEEKVKPKRKASRTSRIYIHKACGTKTQISGADFDHITDPFWICTGTYCCGCEKNVDLSEVFWKNTREPVSQFRRRMRRETPLFLQIWHFGLGPVLGCLTGILIGYAIGINTPGRAQPLWTYLMYGGLIGIGTFWVIGKFLFNRLFGINYCDRR